MSMFDDIALVCSEFDDSWLLESLEAAERLEALRQQYNALAPDWSQAPDWAKWFCIEPGGMYEEGFSRWWAHEPVLNSKEWTPSIVLDGGYSATCFAGHVHLPLGIDWRLCKWQRP